MVYLIALFVIAVVPAAYLLLTNRALAKELLLDLRVGRVFHYFVLFLFGYILYQPNIAHISTTQTATWIKMGLYFIVLAYAAVFAIATNNKEDLEIDRITNAQRPLVREAVEPKTYLTVATLSLIWSLIFSVLVDWRFTVAVSAISVVYYIYSCKPFKVKRFVILAKLLIGFNSLISAYCGFLLAGGTLKSFPIYWLIFILIPVSLMANFIDLKDTDGDRIARIKTLPVILGEPTAKLLIALFTLSAYSMVYVYFNSLFIGIVLFISCSMHIFLLFRKPYQEKPLFLLHNSLFLGLILLLLFRPYFPF